MSNEKPQFIKSKAAVAWGPGQPLKIEEVDVMLPKAGEVLVRIVATGVCHTDAFTLSGDDPEGIFPAVLGHEGAGIVVEIGDDDFITRGQCGDDCIGGMESQRGHILTKNDSVGCIYP